MSQELEQISEKVSGMSHDAICKAVHYRDCRIEELENVLQTVLDDNHAFGHTDTATLNKIEKIKR